MGPTVYPSSLYWSVARTCRQGDVNITTNHLDTFKELSTNKSRTHTLFTCMRHLPQEKDHKISLSKFKTKKEIVEN